MPAEVKPYPAYKDSGVVWLGAVPAHWEIRHLGRMGRLFKGGGGTKEDARESGVPCVRYGDLYTQHQFFITATRACVTPELANTVYTPIRYGDVLFAGSGETIDEIGKSAVNLVPGPACCGGDVIILRPSINADARFLGYAMDCAATARQKACIGRGFTVVHIYSSDLKYVTVAIPPLPEQAAIVRFLDHADRRIRRYIRGKEKLIALLEEQKQAIIHEAVTGRIDVRTGEPYPTYKDSGIEWLGRVPEHWHVSRLGALLRERGEMNDDGRVSEVLSVVRGRGVIPYAEKGNIGNKKSEDITRYKIVRPDDIVVNCMNVIIGSVGLSRYRGCLSPVYYVLTRRSKSDHPQYLNSYFQTRPLQESLVRIGKGILAHRMRIPMELLKCEPFPHPPFEEQADIVSFLDDTTRSIGAAVAGSRHQIERVREYRTRLITDVVTGKVDVREAAAGLPKADPLDTESDLGDDIGHDARSDVTSWQHAADEGGSITTRK